MRSFVGKENQTKCTFLQDKDLFQITLSCLSPNKYTVKRVGKYRRAVNLKKDIERYMMSILARIPTILLIFEAI